MRHRTTTRREVFDATDIGSDNDGYATTQEVLAIAEESRQDRQTTESANERPEVDEIFRRRLHRAVTIAQPMAAPCRQGSDGGTTH